MAKDPGRRRARNARRNQRLYQRATTDVQLQNQPSIDMLNSQLQQAQQDFQRSNQYASSAYGGFQDELAALPRPQFGQIADDLAQRIGGATPMALGADVNGVVNGINVGLSAPESQAGGGYAAALGAAGQTALSNEAAREGMYRTSAGREGALSERYAKDNLLQSMQDTLQSYNDKLSNIAAQEPWMIKQRQGELRQQGIENKLANSQLKGDRAFSRWLQDYIGGQVTPNTRNNNRNENNRPSDPRDANGDGVVNQKDAPPGYDPRPNSLGDFTGGSHVNDGGGGGGGAGPTDPWAGTQYNHPLASYTHGNLLWEWMTPEQKQAIRQGIVQYASTHPEAFGHSQANIGDMNRRALLEWVNNTYPQAVEPFDPQGPGWRQHR